MNMLFYKKKRPVVLYRKPLRRASGPIRRGRLRMLVGLFVVCFGSVFGKLFYLGFQDAPPDPLASVPPSVARPNILDRNGNVLAMDVPVSSIFVEPRRMVDIDEAVEGLTAIFPDLDPADLYQRFDRKRGFAWVKRQVTMDVKQTVWNLGIPALGFRAETQRLYPNGNIASHILGSVNTDNIGIAGIERWIDGQGLQSLRDAGLSPSKDSLEPINLSIDVRAQFALTEELRKAVEKYSASAAAGLVMDVTNGEVLALVSLPDFDPNIPAQALQPDRINRVAVGTFEMGSTFKALTTAMALDSGRFNLASVIDASRPLRFGRSTISDYRGQNRPLNLPEAFIHSSNIVMGSMALSLGKETQQLFLKRTGQFDRLVTELPENAMPIIPARWGDVTTATVSFGHGIAVTPLQASMAIASLVNGGNLIRPTFIKGADVQSRLIDTNIVKPETGEAIRYLMRLNAEIGSAKKADIGGFYIGGKTGTAEKVVNGRYSGEKVLTAFMGVAPMDNPRYLFMTILDEPQPSAETYGFRTSGWNAVPATGDIVARVMPILGVTPSWFPPDNPFPRMVASGAWGGERFTPAVAAGLRQAASGELQN